jgi:hypothetical protein
MIVPTVREFLNTAIQSMKKYFFLVFISLISFACSKDENGNNENIPDNSFSESFDDAKAAEKEGWTFINNSIDLGATQWSNPSVPPFNAFASLTGQAGYLWADYKSTSSAAGIISNWAVSPILTIQNGDKISFYTRSELYYFNKDSTDFGNRLQVRMNPKNTGVNTGSGESYGDFNVLLLDINPTYLEFLYTPFVNRDPDARLAYPHRWTKFEAVVKDLSNPVEGRFAFRYFVEDAGNNGRSTSIGIDEVKYESVKK